MGFRFRKSFKVAKGVRLNVSKSGISTTIGKRGLSVSSGKRGTRLNVGIPGTGVSYSTKLGGSSKPKRTPAAPVETYTPAPAGTSSKSHGLALLLCIFLGYFGVHYFYAGRIGMGFLYLFTIGLCGIGWIVDIVRICKGTFVDSEGNII